MKHLLLIVLAAVLQTSTPLFAQSHTEGGLEWYTDLMKAQEKSKATNKPIFGFFTGSDWCGWCHKLQNDVFSKPAFVKWAKEKVILLELDFPRRKQLSPELMQQNGSLQQAFRVQGYPTIWMFTMEKDKATPNMNINPLGSLGYPSGAEPGKEEVKFLSEANNILSKKQG
jgi:thioredoxin-related protein